ncbi:hypothetical protein IWQ60_008551 [Tieghemiomyces parasiticus]|uniref:Cytochrome P450 n=1 Tax=Tieghemiomyces parasiticus TaxID=78921 RepID=A0A9W7ZZP5_9FUNG|nr:hypothetical protein IWQ60_008551 [Tieghemiomyces parasiticus]
MVAMLLQLARQACLFFGELWSTNTYEVALVLSGVGLLALYLYRQPRTNVPMISGGYPLLGHLHLFSNTVRYFAEAHAKYGDIFRFRLCGYEYYVVNGKLIFEGFRRFKDLSFYEALPRSALVTSFFGEQDTSDTSHIHLLRTTLPKKFDVVMDNIQRILEAKTHETLAVAADGVIGVKVIDQPYLWSVQVVGSAIAQFLFGPELGTDPEMFMLMLRLPENASTLFNYSRIFPLWVMDFWVQNFTAWPEHRRTIRKHVIPEIERRLAAQALPEADRPAPPEDLLQWMIEVQPRDHADWMDRCARRMLAMSFASVHTTSFMFHRILAHLSGHPELRAKLRAEQRTVVEHSGPLTSPAALDAMVLLDACIQEASRTANLAAAFQRVTTVDTVFANGQIIPKGSTVYLSPVAINCSAELYGEDWDTFRPERFLEGAAGMGDEKKTKAYTKSTAIRQNLLSFGSGRHVCPGRFLAVSEIKRMLCILLRRYDFETASGTPFVFNKVLLQDEVVDQPLRFIPLDDPVTGE